MHSSRRVSLLASCRDAQNPERTQPAISPPSFLAPSPGSFADSAPNSPTWSLSSPFTVRSPHASSDHPSFKPAPCDGNSFKGETLRGGPSGGTEKEPPTSSEGTLRSTEISAEDESTVSKLKEQIAQLTAACGVRDREIQEYAARALWAEKSAYEKER